jgi:hypothetical protein
VSLIKLTCWHHVTPIQLPVRYTVISRTMYAPSDPRSYHDFCFLFFRLRFDSSGKAVSSPPFSPRIFLFADIVTEGEPVVLLRSTAVASASFMLGCAPQCRIKHETKKPFVESSSGEHLKTASVSLPMIYQLASTIGRPEEP